LRGGHRGKWTVQKDCDARHDAKRWRGSTFAVAAAVYPQRQGEVVQGDLLLQSGSGFIQRIIQDNRAAACSASSRQRSIVQLGGQGLRKGSTLLKRKASARNINADRSDKAAAFAPIHVRLEIIQKSSSGDRSRHVFGHLRGPFRQRGARRIETRGPRSSNPALAKPSGEPSKRLRWAVVQWILVPMNRCVHSLP